LCSQFGQIAGTSLSIDITNINGSTFNVSQIFTAYLEIAASAIIFMMLCQRLPGLAASMMNGSPNLTAGAAIATAMQVSNAVTGVIKAGAGAAAGAAGGAGGAASLGGGGGGLMEAASIDDGIGGGGTMSPGQTSLGSEAKGGGFGDGPVTSDVTSSSSLSNGSSAIGSTANGSNTKGDVGSPVSSNGTIGQPSAAKSGVSGSAIAKELVGAVSAATSPLIGFDEGGGGGSVHIGLKLPE
jgi:type IV secretion system protein TrbL